MKNIAIIVFLANITSFVYASENLKFILDHKYRITAYNNHNMNFYTPPAEFIGKNVFKVIPLSTKDQTEMEKALQKSANENIQTFSAYSLNEEVFMAYIQPLKTIENDQEKSIFIVKIMESKPRLR